MNEGPVWNGLTGSKNDWLRMEGREVTPDETDYSTLVREVIATQEGLVKCGQAIKTLQTKVAKVPDVADLAEELIEAQENQSTELLAAYVQHQELLDGYDSVDDLRYWVEQARRFRFTLAELTHQDPDELIFPGEAQYVRGLSPEEKRIYERGTLAGYGQGFSEASKGLPCRLEPKAEFRSIHVRDS